MDDTRDRYLIIWMLVFSALLTRLPKVRVSICPILLSLSEVGRCVRMVSDTRPQFLCGDNAFVVAASLSW